MNEIDFCTNFTLVGHWWCVFATLFELQAFWRYQTCRSYVSCTISLAFSPTLPPTQKFWRNLARSYLKPNALTTFLVYPIPLPFQDSISKKSECLVWSRETFKSNRTTNNETTYYKTVPPFLYEMIQGSESLFIVNGNRIIIIILIFSWIVKLKFQFDVL